MRTERAVFDFEVRDVEEARGRYTRLEGRAVPYNTWTNVGPYMEQFKPGAFNKSIREGSKPLPLHLFHSRESPWPVGHAEKWQSQADGLYGVWAINDTEQAQRAAAMAESGDLGYLSIEFTEIRSLPEPCPDREYNPALGVDHMDRYTRVEARLVGTSLVTTPAYADAQVLAVREYRRPPGPDPYPRLTAWKRERSLIR